MVVLAAILLSACSGRADRVRPTADPESLLWGGSTCRDAADCPSNLCSMGICLGYLAASSEEARETVAPAIRELGESPQVSEMQRLLVEALENRESDAFVRGRAADAFRFLPKELSTRVLPAYLIEADEPVRFFVARALAAAGNQAGIDALASFADHPAQAVRTLARRAAGVPGDRDALPGVDQGVNRK